jgi:diaminohydroxyphosphoribosylaminopyrimidine deaminase/5-amino-6-(5-phosphoribosylamino)uracil reductase
LSDPQQDAHWMRRALRLAEKGFTPPNPMVGCVIVREGMPVGEGFHPVAGQPHAEVFALRAAGEKARGATAYVTLEPCSHWGRTPPCADALIAAGVSRVVAAAQDDNPRVGGKGLERLRAAGIAVTVGTLEAQARQQNEAFFHFHATGTPFVTLKAAMTLDGKIATRTGDSKWITAPAARRYVHRLRAQSGAVLVGIETLLADNALLNARLRPAPPRQPLRIVVDSRLRTPPDAAAVRLAAADPGANPLLIATTEQADAEKERRLQQEGVEIVRFPADREGHVDLTALCAHLAKREVISILAEGGGRLHAALLHAQLAQKVLFFVAPKLIGGRDAPTPVEGQGLAVMAAALPVETLRTRRLGPDLLLSGYLRSP